MSNNKRFCRVTASSFSFMVFLFAVFSGCSSAPKKPAEIYTERNIAANQLNLANQTTNQGRFEDALVLLEEARRLALAADDPVLRIKTSMSRGNILFAIGRHEEAFQEWESAAAEGQASGEKVLAALARIYVIKGSLILLDIEGEGETAAAVEEFKARLNREMVLVKSDPYAVAAGNVTLGIAEKQLRRWAEAESAVKKALAFHEKNLYIEDAAYDWFFIASIRSMAGNYDAALQALRTALSFDRRAENSIGLASDWQAMGEVYQKAGRSEESRTSFQRAAEIYRAIGLNERAERLDERLY
jgi:tetratricopeptide (TPR) repeat protein